MIDLIGIILILTKFKLLFHQVWHHTMSMPFIKRQATFSILHGYHRSELWVHGILVALQQPVKADIGP